MGIYGLALNPKRRKLGWLPANRQVGGKKNAGPTHWGNQSKDYTPSSSLTKICRHPHTFRCEGGAILAWDDRKPRVRRPKTLNPKPSNLKLWHVHDTCMILFLLTKPNKSIQNPNFHNSTPHGDQLSKKSCLCCSIPKVRSRRTVNFLHTMTQNYHTFLLLDSPNMGNGMTPSNSFKLNIGLVGGFNRFPQGSGEHCYWRHHLDS